MGWFSCYAVLATYGGREHAPGDAVRRASQTNMPGDRARAWSIARNKWIEDGKPGMCADCQTEIISHDHSKIYGRRRCTSCANRKFKLNGGQ